MKFSLSVLLLLFGLPHVASANWFDQADPAVIYANALSAPELLITSNTEDQLPQIAKSLNEAPVTTKAYPSLEQLRAFGVISEVVNSAPIEKFVVSAYKKSLVAVQSFDIVMREMEQQRLKDLALLQQKTSEELQAYYAKRDILTSTSSAELNP